MHRISALLIVTVSEIYYGEKWGWLCYYIYIIIIVTVHIYCHLLDKKSQGNMRHKYSISEVKKTKDQFLKYQHYLFFKDL